MNENTKKLNRDIIKYIAMFTMLLNHIATVFLEEGTLPYEILISIGYFTAITMIYFLVEGYHYTKSKKKYIERLFLFGLLSEFPFCLAFSQGKTVGFYGLNMMFTLCICFGIIWVMENVKSKAARILLIFLGICLSIICDWGLLAPIFTVLFVRAKKDRKKEKTAFLISALLFGAMNFVSGLGSFSLPINALYALLNMAGIGLAAVCILYFYNGQKMTVGRTFSKWFFYLFYPLHLLILGILRIAIC